MNQYPHTRLDRARALLATGLAALLIATSASGQSSPDSIRRLQEENAALRKRLAEMEGQPAAQQAAPAASTSRAAAPSVQPISSTEPAPKDVVVLSPFEVNSERDFGYLKTNSATATRIGMEIQKVPMNISVLSEDFLKDTNAQSLTDLFRYSASASGDTRFAMRRPANEATPQGSFTMRGFTVNTVLRNSVYRYTAYNLDNVDRVEIVKGPAAVFFGQGYPGGVINYITKKPQFSRIPTTLRYSFNSEDGQKVVMDHNQQLSDKAAFRVVGAWENTGGQRNFEFRKNFNLTPSLTLVPFEDGRLRVNLEVEHLISKSNQNDWDWIFPQGWFDAYANPSAALITASGVADAAAYRSRIFASLGNYIADVRKNANDPGLPLYTSVQRGAFYMDKSGKRVHDEDFNGWSRGAYIENKVNVFTGTVDYSPTDWLDARYVFTSDNNRYDSVEGITYPNADSRTFNTILSGNSAGYYRQTTNHQLDLIAKADFFGVKNKFLAGYVNNTYEQRYNANVTNNVPLYFLVPGFNYPTAPSGPGTLPPAWNTAWNVPVNQVIKDRYGNIKTAAEVYTQWDPGTEIAPPVDKVFGLVDRNLLDGYKPKQYAWYLNWQGSLLDDRLTLLAGYRKEHHKDTGQHLIANYPWFIPPPEAFRDPAKYPESVYNYSGNYARTNFEKKSGNSWMGGASFALTKDISVYASVSKTFKFNFGNVGGFFPGDEAMVIQSALTKGGGSFQYLGQTITSVAQGQEALRARGAYDLIKNEEGINYEVGAKIQLWDSKLVGTFALFRGERENQKLDDGARQSNIEEPLNYSTTLFAPGTAGYNTRNFRWRTTDLKNRIEGIEAEMIYQPTRNLQAIINGSWLFTAETVYDKTRAAPGTAAYNALSAAAKVASDIYYDARIENVPEFKLAAFAKYTYTDNIFGEFGRGLAVGLGGRYVSKTVISRSVDWNPLRNGLQAGNYVVFDATLSYPWELLGYKLDTTLGVYNLTDKDYLDGSFVMAPARNWLLTTTVSF